MSNHNGYKSIKQVPMTVSSSQSSLSSSSSINNDGNEQVTKRRKITVSDEKLRQAREELLSTIDYWDDAPSSAISSLVNDYILDLLLQAKQLGFSDNEINNMSRVLDNVYYNISIRR
jgi:hypothetical protein